MKELKYIDAHCHINFDDFDVDREAVIIRAREAGVGMIIVGTDREKSARAVEIAEKYDHIWAIIGLHPIHAREEMSANGGVFDYDYYLKLAQHPKVVGIGECGYDYFRTENDYDMQHEAFIKQIDIANEVKKPLMLHLRNSKNNGGEVGGVETNPKSAYSDALVVLKKRTKVAGDAHFFAGTVAEAKQFLDLGFNLSFTGVITFARSYDEVIRMAPLDRIMSETDCPYVTPEPHRGERNEPVFVTEIAHKIAEIRGESIDVVVPQLVANANRLFSLGLK